MLFEMERKLLPLSLMCCQLIIAVMVIVLVVFFMITEMYIKYIKGNVTVLNAVGIDE